MSALTTLRRALHRAVTLGRRERMSEALREELALHQELLERDFARMGMPPGDARSAARRKLGNSLAIRERSADHWGLPWLDHLRHDVHYGLRLAWRSPMVSSIVIGAVAVAVGINAGFFTLVDTFFWQPVPVVRPERLVRLWLFDHRNITSIRFSYPELSLLRGARSLSDVAAYQSQPAAVRFSPNTDAVQSSVGIVSGNYFTFVGGRPAIGRFLSTDDDAAVQSPAVVLSDAAWSRWYARSPAVVGQDVVVNGAHATVIGVAGSDFVGLNPLVPDVWMTAVQADPAGLVPGRLLDPRNRFLVLHARLGAGYSAAAAQQELSALVSAAEAAASRGDSARRVAGVRLTASASMIQTDARTMAMLAPAVVLVLLIVVIACANLANLLLARALVRQREVGIRLAIGASRARLISQLLTESAILAAAGCVLGYVLARIVVSVATREFFSNVPTTFGNLAFTVHPSWRIVVLTAGVGALSVVSFGLAPALQATTPSLTAALKGDDQALGLRLRRSRARDLLIAVQVAASLVLLCAAAIIANGVRSFAATGTGLHAAPVLVSQYGIAVQGHVSSALARRRDEFLQRVERSSSVASAARAVNPPFSAWPYLHVTVANETSEPVALQSNRVSPRYFDVVGQRVVRGRRFAAEDGVSLAPVVVVSESAARSLWPHQSPIDQRVRILGSAGAPDRTARVIGEVADAHNGMLWDDDAAGAIFEPARSADYDSLDCPLLVKAARSVAATQADLEAVARAIDPNTPLDVTRLLQLREQQILPFRYGAIVTTAVGLAGLALAVIGLYGVVSFSVKQRQRDIAIRLAVGAGALDIMAVVLRRELRLVLAGLAVGLILSAGESALIGTLSLPVPALGVLKTTAVAALLLVVAAIAAAFPTRDALRVSPMQVLRQE